MKHAYLIMAHKNTRQLGMLLKVLDHSLNDIYVHCDIRFYEATLEVLSSYVSKSNLVLLSQYAVGWGSYSQVKVEMLLLERASSVDSYAYYHLLSGQDFPLKTQDEIHRSLDGVDREFIHFTCPQEWERVIQRRISVVRHTSLAARSAECSTLEYYLSLLKCRLGFGRLDPSVVYGYGSQWFSVTDKFARDLVAHKDWVDAHFSHAMCPDEHVVQSFVLTFGYERNLFRPIGDGSYDACMRLIEWTDEDESHPIIWREKDRDILEAAPHWFVRKLDMDIDCEILNTLFVRIQE